MLSLQRRLPQLPSPSLPELVTHPRPCMPFTFTGTQKGRNFLLHFLPQLSALK